MFRTRRQNRYEALREARFLPFEASAFSKISFAVPYMVPLIKKRIDDYDKFIADGGKATKWTVNIRKLYIDKGWHKVGDGWNQNVAFRMLKAAEEQHKYKHPQYSSPWEKRQKNWTDFTEKIEATYQKYSRGKTYGKRKPPVKLEYLPGGGARIVD